MLDLKFIRNNEDLIKEGMRKRGEEIDISILAELDDKRKEILYKVEKLKNERNTVSQEIAKMKKQGGNADDKIAKMKNVSQEIKDMDEDLKKVEIEIHEFLLRIPNIPHESVPIGESEDENVEVRNWGEKRNFNFDFRAHWDVGEGLGILDFAKASKITGARFALYQGLGARLERALVNFMLDYHTSNHGYKEIFPPFIVNRDSLTGTGQLPKFEEDVFKLEGKDYFLIPTAEVPVTNIHRDEIIPEDELPIYYAAFSGCFRSEAGSHGKDTRGLIRQHQFNKVELVKFVAPETSYHELESLTNNAEKILQELNLPYRVASMCTADLGFTAAKKYDIEVWMPSYDRYVEISSCSNFTDFQARRADIKYRPKDKGKAQYLHTLNGSGLAVGRTVAAILENYQQEDGSVEIPEALQPYMGGVKKITK